MNKEHQELKLIWDTQIYPNIREVYTDKDKLDPPKDIMDITQKLSYCFSKSIINKLDQDAVKEIKNLLEKIESLFPTFGTVTTNNKIFFYINNHDEYKGLLVNILNIFHRLPDIDVYIDLYNRLYKEGLLGIKEAKEEYNERIAELLGKTTETYLFTEFQKKADNLHKKIKNNEIIFYVVIILMIIFGICSFVHKPEINSNFDTFYYLTSRLFIAFPLIFSLLFINRSIRDDRKLEQTYRHKEVVSKSYLNYLDFLEKKGKYFEDNIEIVRKNLSQIVVESLGLNPALLLEKSTAEKIPMEELLSKIIDKSIAPNKGKE